MMSFLVLFFLVWDGSFFNTYIFVAKILQNVQLYCFDTCEINVHAMVRWFPNSDNFTMGRFWPLVTIPLIMYYL